MCLFAYVIAMIVYQIGGFIIGEVAFNVFTVIAALLLIGLIYLIFRKGYQGGGERLRAVDAAHAEV